MCVGDGGGVDGGWSGSVGAEEGQRGCGEDQDGGDGGDFGECGAVSEGFEQGDGVGIFGVVCEDDVEVFQRFWDGVGFDSRFCVLVEDGDDFWQGSLIK